MEQQGTDDGGRHETADERHDRNFNELLQELRVAQTGVQILVAFLLATAFTTTMQHAGTFPRVLLAGTLVVSALSVALLIAPVALHRWLFQLHVKGLLVHVVSRLARAGLLLMMFAIAGACLLTLDAVLSRSVAFWLSAGVFAVFVALWVVLPLVLRRAHGHRAQG